MDELMLKIKEYGVKDFDVCEYIKVDLIKKYELLNKEDSLICFFPKENNCFILYLKTEEGLYILANESFKVKKNLNPSVLFFSEDSKKINDYSFNKSVFLTREELNFRLSNIFSNFNKIILEHSSKRLLLKLNLL